VTTPKDNHTNDFIGATEVLANNEQRLRECTSVAVTVNGSGKFFFPSCNRCDENRMVEKVLSSTKSPLHCYG
jgi:glycine cleavage system aminomethyltransferase T